MQYVIKKINTFTGFVQPSGCEYGMNSVNDSDSGRSQSGKMYIGLITEKRTLNLSWNVLRPEDASEILAEINKHKYFTVEYFEPSLNDYTTRTFYVGDRKINFLQWFEGGEAFSSLSFQIIER